MERICPTRPPRPTKQKHVETSGDNASLQQALQPDPVSSALAKIRIGTATESTTIDTVEKLVGDFIAHVDKQLESMEPTAKQTKQYLTHTRLLLDSIYARLDKVLLSGPMPFDTYSPIGRAQQTIKTFTKRIDNTLKNLEKVLQ